MMRTCSADMEKKTWRWSNSPGSVIMYLLLSLLCVSIPWEFCRLYQTAIGNRAAVASAGFPEECGSGSLSLWQTVKTWLSRQLAWDHEATCDRYFTAMFVDPLWEVTPIMVLMSLVTRCVLHPAELLSEGLGRSLRKFFAHIPLHWQPVCMLLVMAVTLVTLLMICSYRLHVPLLFRIEPKSPIIVQGEICRGTNRHCSSFGETPSNNNNKSCLKANTRQTAMPLTTTGFGESRDLVFRSLGVDNGTAVNVGHTSHNYTAISSEKSRTKKGSSNQQTDFWAEKNTTKKAPRRARRRRDEDVEWTKLCLTSDSDSSGDSFHPVPRARARRVDGGGKRATSAR